MAKKDETPKAGDKLHGVEVIAKADVFYRAGRAWGHAPTVVPLSELTEDELDELKSEPMLLVREVDIARPDESAKA